MTDQDKSPKKTKVFISYSRKNKLFVRKLNDALDVAGVDAWVDWEGIPLSADWMAEITAAIEGADAFLFVISPDSLKSKVCMDELELGIKYKKKIIPILFAEPVKGNQMHPKLASTNWVYMRSKKDDFNATLPKLVATIQTDLSWTQRHTRILQRAAEWVNKNRNKSYLLHGADLEEGEQWALQANPDVGREVTQIQTEYLHTSRKAATQVQRNLLVGVGFALLVSIFLGFVALGYARIADENRKVAETQQAIAVSNQKQAEENQRIAEENRKQAQANEKRAVQSEQRAKAERSASEARLYQEQPGELLTSTLLAVNAYTTLPELADAQDILRSNISLLPLPVRYVNRGARVSKIQNSPDGAKFVVADEGGGACVWDMETGREFFCAQEQGILYDSVFSSDGNFIITGSDEGNVSVWDAFTGEKKVSLKVDGAVWDLSAQPGGTWVAVGASYGVSVLDLKKMRFATTFVMPSDVYKIDFSPSGKMLAMGMGDGNVSIWDIANGRTLAGPQHSKEVLHIAFSHDGKWLVSASADSTARVMKIGDGRQKYAIAHGDWVEYAVFSPDSSWFATASDDGLVRVIDTLSGQERFRMAHGSFVNRVRISRDGNWLISTSYDNTTRVWDASSGVEVLEIPMKGIGSAIEFNADATRVAVGDRNGNVAVWDTSYLKSRTALVKFPEYLHELRFTPNGQWAFANTDDKKIWQIRPDLLGSPADQRKAIINVKGLTYGMAVSPDSQWLAAVEYDSVNADYNRVALYEIATARSYIITHDREVINAVTFTPDSKRVLTCDDMGVVNIWDVQSGEKVGSFQTEGVILSIAVSPDGKYVVAGIEEGNANVVWEMDSGKKVAELDQVGATSVVTFSPDGAWLATGGSESVAQLWQVADGAFTRSENMFRAGSSLQSMSFSPDSSMLAMGDAEGNAYLIDLSRMEEAARFRNINKVTGITFTPDNKQLAIAAFKTINFWKIDSLQFLYANQLTETACARQIENFSAAKWKIIFGDEEYRLICPNLPAGEK